jgi:hypothetical protein
MSRPVRPLLYMDVSGGVTPGSILTAAGGDGAVGRWMPSFQADMINHVGEGGASLFGTFDAHNKLLTGLNKSGVATMEPYLFFGEHGFGGIKITWIDPVNDDPVTSMPKRKTALYTPYDSSDSTKPKRLIPIRECVTELNTLLGEPDCKFVYINNRISLLIRSGTVLLESADPSNIVAARKMYSVIFNDDVFLSGLPEEKFGTDQTKSIIGKEFVGSPDNIYPLPADREINRDYDAIATRTDSSVSLMLSSGSGIGAGFTLSTDNGEQRLLIEQLSGSDYRLQFKIPIVDDTGSAGIRGQVLRSNTLGGGPSWGYGGAAFVKTFTDDGTLTLNARDDSTGTNPDGIEGLYDDSIDSYYVRILAQGGGGGGAGGTNNSGGGGGGAGYSQDVFMRLRKDTELIITVGSGGDGGQSYDHGGRYGTTGVNGEPTIIQINDNGIIQTIEAKGGAGGESEYGSAGAPYGGAGSSAGKDGTSTLGGKGGGLYGGKGGDNVGYADSVMNGGRNTSNVSEFYSGAGGGGGGPNQDGGIGADGFVRIEIYME